MNQESLITIVDDLISYGRETEWIEYKSNLDDEEVIGKLISAISNSARLHDKKVGYIAWGISDSLEIKGTTFKPHMKKIGNEPLENWIAQRLAPRIDFNIREGLYKNVQIVLFEIIACSQTPVSFKNIRYIRVGSVTRCLSDFPEKERALFSKLSPPSTGTSPEMEIRRVYRTDDIEHDPNILELKKKGSDFRFVLNGTEWQFQQKGWEIFEGIKNGKKYQYRLGPEEQVLLYKPVKQKF